MDTARILGVVGARPNYMKMAPIWRALTKAGMTTHWVHTGQHYDAALSEQFFHDLEIPEPDTHLGVGSGSHAEQTARVLERVAPVIESFAPDLVLVGGDVNSTLACTLAAVKLGVPVGHVEAGLRSGDRTMPEEINRVLTDAVSDLLFTTSREAGDHLIAEGRPRDSIHFVGNSMIDTLRRFEPAAAALSTLDDLGVQPGTYLLGTLHRPSNVDEPEDLERILHLLEETSGRLRVLLPLHPRTRTRLESFGLWRRLEGLHAVDALPPLGYLEFLALMRSARVVLTDSGGVQEETTALGVPCLTLRPNTERPVTVTDGTNLLVSVETPRILQALDDLLAGRLAAGARIPELWDGRAGLRIAERIQAWFEWGKPSTVRP